MNQSRQFADASSRPSVLPISTLALIAGSATALAQDPIPTQPDQGEAPQTIDSGSIANTDPATPPLELDIDLADLDLDDLLAIDLQVSSIAGVNQSLQSTPGAVYVLTGEDIRRTGAFNIAEALRVVPGFTVQRITSNIWGISSRGQTSRFANKLLVQVDGRTAYNLLFSGTYWDSTSAVLPDVSRVEIIRGPGATIFGANAVNGVINIETKHAKETQGLLIQGRAGSDLLGGGTFRYGGKIDDNSYFRVYGEYNQFDDGQSNLASGTDDLDQVRAGFRFDHDYDENATLTFIGDFYNSDRTGNSANIIPPFTPTGGAFTPVPTSPFLFDSFQRTYALTGRFTKQWDDGSGIKIQAFYDNTERDIVTFEHQLETFDISFQHNLKWGNINELVYGFSYRNTELDGRSAGSLNPQAIPLERTVDLFSGFIQNTTTLIPDKLFVTYGAKFEDNDFTGFEVQPSVRMSFSPMKNLTFWGAVSRAVRTPNLSEDNALVPLAADLSSGAIISSFAGNPDSESEVLEAYEGGIRWQVNDHANIDFAMFYNEYEELNTVFSTSPLFLPALGGSPRANGAEGDTLGVEVFGEFHVIPDRWTLIPSYTYLRTDFSTGFGTSEAADPEHQFNIQSRFNLTDHVEINTTAYYVDSVGTGATEIDAYVRLDVGMTFRFTPNVELAVWGFNLLDDEHLEGADTFSAERIAVERAVYAQLTLRF